MKYYSYNTFTQRPALRTDNVRDWLRAEPYGPDDDYPDIITRGMSALDILEHDFALAVDRVAERRARRAMVERYPRTTALAQQYNETCGLDQSRAQVALQRAISIRERELQRVYRKKAMTGLLGVLAGILKREGKVAA